MRPLLALLLAAGLAHAADPPHGWSVRYEGTLGRVETRVPSAAFRLAAGEAPHPEVRARGWEASYRGTVSIADAGTYRFGVEAEGGEATLVARDASGREVGRALSAGGRGATTAWVPLDMGAVDVSVEYRRAARGDGRLRTTWEQQPGEGGGFRSEPIPSSAVRVPADRAAAAAEGVLARDGRAWLERKGCTNCHAPDAVTGEAVGTREAPVLDALAGRIRPDWVRRWLADPASTRRGSDMPHLLGDAPADTVEDLVQYLFRADAAPPPAPATHPGTIRQGRRLFHTLGCVACHGPFESAATVFGDPMLPREVPTDDVPVPYGDLRGKWHPGALARFLLEPHVVRPDGSMPSFGLTSDEADALAGYLTTRFDADGEGAATASLVRDPAAATRGREAFGAFGCVACHRVDDATAPPARTALFDLDPTRGCLDPDDRATPRYDLTDAERTTLRRGIESARRAQGVPAPTDAALREFTSLSCTHCHRLDGDHGVRRSVDPYFVTLDDRVDLGDEGRLPPDLSGVGFKLRTGWLRRVVEEGARARPYMGARMPAFGAAASALPETFAALDGVAPGVDVEPPAATDALRRDGLHLLGRDGMSCITCHSYRDWPPAGSPGPSLTAFAERLRYAWWRAYVQAPARYKPGTRMPSFAIGRRSTVGNVLDGDIYRQGDAMWSAFTLGEEMPPPEGIRPASSLKITVRDRTVVLRTFLEHAGSRGIAVGFPAGIHVGFDAEACRLADAWRGDFLDASGAWAGRGGQVAGGRGPDVWIGPQGPPIVFGARPERWPRAIGREAGYRFRGYLLDEAGTPTFRYEVDGVEVRERIEPRRAPRDRLLRTFDLGGAAGRTAWLNAGPGELRVASAEAATVTAHPREDGVTWVEVVIEDGASRARFTVEVGL